MREGGLTPETVFRLHKQMLGNLLVTINVSLNFNDMVAAGNYDNVYINPEFALEDLPPFRNADADREVNLRKQDENTTTGQWFKLLDENPESIEQFCHPFSLLAIGDESQHPDEQRENPIFTVWKSPRTAQLCYAVLPRARSRALPGCRPLWSGRHLGCLLPCCCRQQSFCAAGAVALGSWGNWLLWFLELFAPWNLKPWKIYDFLGLLNFAKIL